jgi:hypothetical protein
MTMSVAERRYRALIHALASDEPDRATANQLGALYRLLGINPEWAADDVERVLDGGAMKPLPEMD